MEIKETSHLRYKSRDIDAEVSTIIYEGLASETAIIHPLYNNGELIVVERYFSHEEAEEGHKKWSTFIMLPELPDEILDVFHNAIKKQSKIGTTELINQTRWSDEYISY